GLRLFIVFVSVFTLFNMPSQALKAAGTVTNCGNFGTVGTSGDLADALSGGGTVTISCRWTIIGPQSTISVNTSITASGTVTLSGNNANRVFLVNSGISLILDDLTISSGKSTIDGGGIENLGGTVVITNSTFYNNSVILGGRGGGIHNTSRGT